MTRSAPRTPALEPAATRAPRHSVQRLVRRSHGVLSFCSILSASSRTFASYLVKILRRSFVYRRLCQTPQTTRQMRILYPTHPHPTSSPVMYSHTKKNERTT